MNLEMNITRHGISGKLFPILRHYNKTFYFISVERKKKMHIFLKYTRNEGVLYQQSDATFNRKTQSNIHRGIWLPSIAELQLQIYQISLEVTIHE